MTVKNETIDINELIEDVVKPADASGLPDPEVVNFYWFNNRRKMFIDFEVDDSMMEFERFILKWNIEDKGKEPEKREPIWIYLMNYGGDAHLMFAMVDIIAMSKTPVYTVNLGQCASAAAIIFLAGHKRYMMPGATMLIHRGSGAIEGDADKVLDQAASYKAMLDKMNKYILERTNISPRMLSRKRASDWEIDAQFCIENGVCDKIIESIDDII